MRRTAYLWIYLTMAMLIVAAQVTVAQQTVLQLEKTATLKTTDGQTLSLEAGTIVLLVTGADRYGRIQARINDKTTGYISKPVRYKQFVLYSTGGGSRPLDPITSSPQRPYQPENNVKIGDQAKLTNSKEDIQPAYVPTDNPTPNPSPSLTVNMLTNAYIMNKRTPTRAQQYLSAVNLPPDAKRVLLTLFPLYNRDSVTANTLFAAYRQTFTYSNRPVGIPPVPKR